MVLFFNPLSYFIEKNVDRFWNFSGNPSLSLDIIERYANNEHNAYSLNWGADGVSFGNLTIRGLEHKRFSAVQHPQSGLDAGGPGRRVGETGRVFGEQGWIVAAVIDETEAKRPGWYLANQNIIITGGKRQHSLDSWA